MGVLVSRCRGVFTELGNRAGLEGLGTVDLVGILVVIMEDDDGLVVLLLLLFDPCVTGLL